MNGRMRTEMKRRKYGARHKARRALLVPLVAAGVFDCWRCGEPIGPGEAWHLGHSDDGSHYKGPEHAHCNCEAAARYGNAVRRVVPSRAW